MPPRRSTRSSQSVEPTPAPPAKPASTIKRKRPTAQAISEDEEPEAAPKPKPSRSGRTSSKPAAPSSTRSRSRVQESDGEDEPKRPAKKSRPSDELEDVQEEEDEDDMPQPRSKSRTTSKPAPAPKKGRRKVVKEDDDEHDDEAPVPPPSRKPSSRRPSAAPAAPTSRRAPRSRSIKVEEVQEETIISVPSDQEDEDEDEPATARPPARRPAAKSANSAALVEKVLDDNGNDQPDDTPPKPTSKRGKRVSVADSDANDEPATARPKPRSSQPANTSKQTPTKPSRPPPEDEAEAAFFNPPISQAATPQPPPQAQQQQPEEPKGPKARLVIHKMALVDFKSYAGRQEIGATIEMGDEYTIQVIEEILPEHDIAEAVSTPFLTPSQYTNLSSHVPHNSLFLRVPNSIADTFETSSDFEASPTLSEGSWSSDDFFSSPVLSSNTHSSSPLLSEGSWSEDDFLGLLSDLNFDGWEGAPLSWFPPGWDGHTGTSVLDPISDDPNLAIESTSNVYESDASAAHPLGQVEPTYFDSGRLTSMIVINQDRYIHPTKRGRTRYGQPTEDCVSFRMPSAQVDGIVLRAALDGATLAGGEDIVTQEHAVNVILHILWPGYEPWNTLLRTKNWAKGPQPISRSELAKRLARAIIKFTGNASLRVQASGSESLSGTSTLAAPADLTADSIVLRSFYPVTKGGWQVELGVLPSVKEKG